MRFSRYAAIKFATFAIAVAATSGSPRPVSRSQTNGSAIPIFKHSRFIHTNKSIDLDTINSHIAFVHSKVFLGFNNYERNTGLGQFSTVIQKREAADAILLATSAGQPWSVQIKLGGPGPRSKKFYVSLDTTSSDSFLPEVRCDSTCDGHQRWNPLQSRTARSMRRPCWISYSDGSYVSGGLFTDRVFIMTSRFTTLLPQLICAVTYYPPVYRSPDFTPDGVLGMAFSSISSYGANTIFQSLVDQGQVADPVFSVQLLDSGGELYLGGVNTELFSGTFTYVPVIRPGFWLVEMEGIVVYDLLTMNGGAAIIDTNAIFISGPSYQVEQLQHALGGTLTPNLGDGIYVFPCSLMPMGIALSFGGTLFPIPGRSLSLGEVDTESGGCMSAIVARDIKPGVDLWVLGTPFLKHVYSTFDARNNPQVGFATLANPS